MFSLVWESKLGFSMSAFTKTQTWFFTCGIRERKRWPLEVSNMRRKRFGGFVFGNASVQNRGSLYLERFDRHSRLVFFLHNFNKFGHYLINHVVDVPTTLGGKNNQKKNKLQKPFKC